MINKLQNGETKLKDVETIPLAVFMENKNIFTINIMYMNNMEA